MAIIQISKIQVRSGNIVDLPQLDEAEFGWASDTKRLFIGKSTPNENIEVLTSYSDIDFSQLTGSYGNLNISNPHTGQLLAFDKNSNAWVNAGGNALDPGEPSYWSSNLIHLGNISTLKIGGGGAGYVLETDGAGNLTWTPKGTISANIANATTTNPVVITTTSDNFFVSGDNITITNVSGMTELNGNSYYANILTSNTFSLYYDSALLNPVDGTGYTSYIGNGRVIASVGGSGGGGGAAGGATYSVQYNYGGIATGDASFTWNNTIATLTVTGTSNVTGNFNVTSNITSNRITSNVLSTTGNANIGNIGTAGIITATGNINGGNLVTAGNVNGNVVNANSLRVSGVSNLGPVGNVIITGGTSGQYLQTNGSGSLIWQTINTSSISNGNSNVSIPAANGNVTVSAVGNANIVVITGTGANINGTLNVSANANFSNLGANALYPVLLSVSGTSNLGPVGNITITGGNANQLLKTNGSGVLSWTDPTGGYYLHTQNSPSTTWTVIHNLNNQYISVNPIDSTGNSYVGRYDYPTVNYTNANAVTLTFTSAVAGYVAVVGGGFTYSNGGGSGTPGGLNTYVQFNDGGIFGGQPSLTFDKVTGTLSTAILNSTIITTGANTTPGLITGNWTLTSGSQLQATYADLAEYYEADEHYEPGTVLMFGGEKEVTIAVDGTTKVAGVVSTNPAYLMNSDCKGYKVALALQGRVPVKVRGKITKGDLMVSAGNGFARPWNHASIGMVIGKAIQNFDGIEGLIEVAIGRL